MPDGGCPDGGCLDGGVKGGPVCAMHSGAEGASSGSEGYSPDGQSADETARRRTITEAGVGGGMACIDLQGNQEWCEVAKVRGVVHCPECIQWLIERHGILGKAAVKAAVDWRDGRAVHEAAARAAA